MYKRQKYTCLLCVLKVVLRNLHLYFGNYFLYKFIFVLYVTSHTTCTTSTFTQSPIFMGPSCYIMRVRTSHEKKSVSKLYFFANPVFGYYMTILHFEQVGLGWKRQWSWRGKFTLTLYDYGWIKNELQYLGTYLHL